MSETDKIEAIYQMCVEFKEKHAKAETHFEYVSRELLNLRKDTDILKEHKANWIGKVSILGVVIGGLFTMLGYWVSKHF